MMKTGHANTDHVIFSFAWDKSHYTLKTWSFRNMTPKWWFLFPQRISYTK